MAHSKQAQLDKANQEVNAVETSHTMPSHKANKHTPINTSENRHTFNVFKGKDS